MLSLQGRHRVAGIYVGSRYPHGMAGGVRSGQAKIAGVPGQSVMGIDHHVYYFITLGSAWHVLS